MEILPAIDLKNGRVVRLVQGRMDRETVYFDNPLVPARAWLEAGAEWVHVVDLEGAFSGRVSNWHAVEAIADLGLKVQFGGGLRDALAVGEAFSRGVSRVILGTRAAENPEFVADLVKEFGERIVVGIDAREGKVLVRGWRAEVDTTAVDLARRLEDCGVATLVVTDVNRDRLAEGPDLEGQRAMARAVSCTVIGSGGLATLEDLRRERELFLELPNFAGVVLGKALYERRFSLAEALETARGDRQK